VSASPRRERTLVLRRRLLLIGLLAGAAVLAGRATQVQVVERDMWSEAALRQHRTSREVAAPRGTILDRDGVPLAVSREVVRVSVAPGEIRDTALTRERLVHALGLSAAEVRRLTDPSRSWRVIPGTHEPSVADALAGLHGVHIERLHQRFYPRGDLARGVLGGVVDEAGAGGIEEFYDAVLRGQPGKVVAARDHRGREIPGESLVVEAAVAGGEVRLTLDLDLQEIAHQELKAALATTGALGGDLVVTDPRTGEILAMVSVRAGRTDALSAINTPYEPGSTLKPFTVAAVLENGVGRLTDSIDTEDGRWAVAGTTMTDTRPHGVLTLGDALRVSSNVAVAMAAASLGSGAQYQSLRDFGFGAQTGIPLPGEVAGTLRRPSRWSARSSASLAIGYELAVTPLQMAMAYGALANGGSLMEPRLVREVRSPGGDVVERLEPRVVREVISQAVAREVGRVLVEVVEEGTGTAARLETFQVAGKTGTSRAYTEGGGYEGGSYFSSFGAYFPADDAQLVVFVKLDSPQGAYYGGATAAPVTRSMMEAALAARQTPLDRRALLRAQRTAPLPPPHSTATPVAFASASDAPAQSLAGDGAVAAHDLPSAPEAPWLQLQMLELSGTAQSLDGAVQVPDVTGLPLRVAARRLHTAGLRVTWDGGAAVFGTLPSAGSRVQPGDTVHLITMGDGRP